MTRRSSPQRTTDEDTSGEPTPARRSLAAWLADGIRLFKSVPAKRPAAVEGISWREFEARICAAFRREGFRLDARGRAAPDPGIDLIAVKARKRLLIQCKHWQAQQVSVAAIRELSEIVAARKADGGVLVCGGTFTKEAQDFAQLTGIRLIDGGRLVSMLGSASMKHDTVPLRDAVPVVTEVVERHDAPECPKCGQRMGMRQATRGTLVGHFFWICENSPNCSGIIPCNE